MTIEQALGIYLGIIIASFVFSVLLNLIPGYFVDGLQWPIFMMVSWCTGALFILMYFRRGDYITSGQEWTTIMATGLALYLIAGIVHMFEQPFIDDPFENDRVILAFKAIWKAGRRWGEWLQKSRSVRGSSGSS